MTCPCATDDNAMSCSCCGDSCQCGDACKCGKTEAGEKIATCQCSTKPQGCDCNPCTCADAETA